MRRYWVPKDCIQQGQVIFLDEIFHHIFDVCRQEKGSKFEVLAGDSKAHFVEVIEVKKRQALAQILETREINPIKKPHLHLAIAVPRFPVFEAVLEKAVEMGVTQIHPFFSDFSFVKTDIPENKLERWNKIVISATQQSGRGELMGLSKAKPLTELLQDFNRKSSAWGLLAYEGESQTDIQTALKNPKPEGLEEAWIFVGGEGGFSHKEIQLFQEFGLPSVTLGEQVLRVETACIALLAVLKYHFELMR